MCTNRTNGCLSDVCRSAGGDGEGHRGTGLVLEATGSQHAGIPREDHAGVPMDRRRPHDAVESPQILSILAPSQVCSVHPEL